MMPYDDRWAHRQKCIEAAIVHMERRNGALAIVTKEAVFWAAIVAAVAFPVWYWLW